MAWIYALCEPDDGAIRYVGKCEKPKKRLVAHINESGDTAKHVWLSSLKSQGKNPLVLLIEEVCNENWQEREMFWISHYRGLGFDLTNSTDGGYGLKGASLATREKLSAIQSKRMSDDNHRAKIFTESRDRKLSESLTGKKKSASHVAKLPQNNKGFKQSDEAIRKRSKSMTGRKLSEEHKRKIGLSNIGHKRGIGNKSRTGQTQSPEERMKKSIANKGRPKSPEHKEKIRQAQLRAWERRRQSNREGLS